MDSSRLLKFISNPNSIEFASLGGRSCSQRIDAYYGQHNDLVSFKDTSSQYFIPVIAIYDSTKCCDTLTSTNPEQGHAGIKKNEPHGIFIQVDSILEFKSRYPIRDTSFGTNTCPYTVRRGKNKNGPFVYTLNQTIGPGVPISDCQ